MCKSDIIFTDCLAESYFWTKLLTYFYAYDIYIAFCWVQYHCIAKGNMILHLASTCAISILSECNKIMLYEANCNIYFIIWLFFVFLIMQSDKVCEWAISAVFAVTY